MATKTGADAVVWCVCVYVQATDLRRMSPWKRKAPRLALSEKNDCGLLSHVAFVERYNIWKLTWLCMYVCIVL